MVRAVNHARTADPAWIEAHATVEAMPQKRRRVESRQTINFQFVDTTRAERFTSPTYDRRGQPKTGSTRGPGSLVNEFA